MKQKRNTINLLLSSFLLVASVGLIPSVVSDVFFDDMEYSDNTVADYAHPVYASDDEEEEEEIGDVKNIVIHYVNDDNKCKERAFYIWGTGVDGKEYSLKGDPDIVTYSDDGGMMTITMDLINDDRFKPLYGNSSIWYIIKYQMISPSNLNWGGQSEDVELRYEEFPPVNEKVEAWCTPAAGGGIAQFLTEEETKVAGVKLAQFVDFKTIACSLTPGAGDVAWDLYAFDESYFKVKPKNRAAIKKDYLVRSGETSMSYFNIDLKYNAHLNVVYSIVSKEKTSTTGLEKTIYVSYENLYGSDRFEALYNYSENDLGFSYSPKQTTFKVWSPVAANITLMVYDSDTAAAYDGNDSYKAWHMVYQKNGIWTLTLKGDLKGKYYNYQVDTWIGTSTTMDPYATGAGACGVRGLIYDKEDSNPENWDSLPVKWDGTSRDIKTPQELSVYEVHVQDFTGDESWVSNQGNKNGTFNAFVEEGTTYTIGDKTVSTGFDHLKELGVSAVQLMPVFDSDNDEVKNVKYNWGYNPLNYNCVEGYYSSNPHDGLARIKEYKNLVMKLAEADMRVIMDVVYNHVSSPSGSCFNKLMPRYFFRYAKEGDPDVEKGWIAPGELYDGSGCHNEFKSEATMARKYIVDSLCMWAEEYKIKGFRFDLMGLIDVETMRAAKKALFAIDPDIYIYGEGWTAGGFHGGWDAQNNKQSEGTFCVGGSGNQVYSQLYDGPEANQIYIGGFNDKGRNAVRGGNDQGWGSETHYPGYGFISQGHNDASESNRIAVQKMIWGCHGDAGEDIGANPKQTVNYASCHDNWTLRDQLYYCLGDGTHAGYGYDVMHASEAVHALIFASNGIAFMLGGEELLRTKDYGDMSEEELVENYAGTYENMYGFNLSHNSYKSPLYVNSFKWGNKISVQFGDEDTLIDTYTENLTGKFADMIKLHNEMPKYDYGQIYEGDDALIHKTSKGQPVENLSWAGHAVVDTVPVDYQGCAGIQFDEYFIYVSGREFGYVNCGSLNSWTQKAKFGGVLEYDTGNKTVNLGNPSYNNGYTFGIYYANGVR